MNIVIFVILMVGTAFVANQLWGGKMASSSTSDIPL